LHNSIDNLALINNQIKKKFGSIKDINIIAVSKTFPKKEVEPLIKHGHIHFGENKVQEAIEKWSEIKNSFDNIKLHMIGRLQTNKVKYVIPLFDYIHSLDSIKLGEKISIEQKKRNKNLKIFIQVNIGGEQQKSGIDPKNLKNFHYICKNELNLNIVGLMCIPPNVGNVGSYFESMAKLKKLIGVKELSMGMSADYIEAIDHESSFIRIGSAIFGNRN